MKRIRLTLSGLVLQAFVVVCSAPSVLAQTPAGGNKNVPVGEPSNDKSSMETQRFSVNAARERAILMHDIYASTLDVMHHRYFHGGRSIVPARAMEDVFADIRQRTQIDARWISVNLKAMSIHHKPKSDFEKRAAKEIAGGKSAVEVVEDGFYRRVGAIPMSSGCISCHDGFFKKLSNKNKFAGLVISVPVLTDSP